MTNWRRAVLILAGTFSMVLNGSAIETVWEYAVQVSAVVQTSPPQITLEWPQDVNGPPAAYTVYRKAPEATSWDRQITLAGGTTRFTDSHVAAGTGYEYQIVKTRRDYTGYGYIYSGINLPLTENRGAVVLIVDKTHAAALSRELARLHDDLAGDGWRIIRHDVSPADAVTDVKELIQHDYWADPTQVKAVFLFGHVPVPYSGCMVPDGHVPGHYGAWPADAYYGDVKGGWTDTLVVNKSADESRNWVVPGHRKFDQSLLPSAVDLEVGRVDLSNLPGQLVWNGPATFPCERELLRQYLNKDHDFRHKVFTVPRRGVVADYFGIRDGEAFAASGFRNFAPFFGSGAITNLNVLYHDARGIWSGHLSTNAYLWAYACGPGSFSTMGGLGTHGTDHDLRSTDIVATDSKAVFTMFFGSWLGDWDSRDNLMRSVLATPSCGLACSWSGRPHFFYHHMGLGETIGYGARLTQNNNQGLYQNQVNTMAGGVHAALMGDPTLRLHPVAPVSNLTCDIRGAEVELVWTASAEPVAGYHVYRSDRDNGTFARLTPSLVTETHFVDEELARENTIYMVRAVKLECSSSGTYFNASQGAFARVKPVQLSALTRASRQPPSR